MFILVLQKSYQPDLCVIHTNKFQIVLDTIMIALRTTTFVLFIIYNPENALLAFGVAQLVAAVFYTISHYAYFHYYIKRVKRHKLKRRLSMSDDGTEEIVESEFPFMSIKDFLPGQLENHASNPLNTNCSMIELWKNLIKMFLLTGYTVRQESIHTHL